MSIQRSMVSEYVWRAVLSRAARAQRGAAQAPQQRCLALSDALHVVSCNRGEKSYFKDINTFMLKFLLGKYFNSENKV